MASHGIGLGLHGSAVDVDGILGCMIGESHKYINELYKDFGFIFHVPSLHWKIVLMLCTTTFNMGKCVKN